MRKFSRRGILIFVLVFVIVLFGGGVAYVENYYHAEGAVDNLLSSKEIRSEGDLTVLSTDRTDGTDGIGLIFYPGAKVEETAYLPLLEQLRQAGVTCVLVKMPFRLAVLRPNAADSVFDLLPEIKTWYIGGHSLGGAMASIYAAKHQENIKGVILLGAYRYGEISAAQTLTIYGSNDQVLDKSKIDYTENVVVIEGGNHAQFGNYGAQKGDGEAGIDANEQQRITVEAILKYVKA